MADVVVLNNGVRFEGLIVEENDQKEKLARYSGHAVSPHTLGLYKRDIARIKRIDPRRRASLEPEVLELLYAAEMARRAAQTAAAWQRVSREIGAHREALEAARRARMTLATGTYPTPQGPSQAAQSAVFRTRDTMASCRRHPWYVHRLWSDPHV